MRFAPIEDAVQAMQRGEFVIAVDDENRENEGDLIIAAEKVTPERMGFMIRNTSGIVCLTMHRERLDELDIPQMVSRNTDLRKTAFTVSIDARDGTTTGISGSDRAATVAVAIDPAATASDLNRPGHVFPLRYREGGVLERPGHTEASIDLARLAGLYEAGVLGELMHDDGTVQRLPELIEFAKAYDMPLISIADLVAYRFRHESLVRRGSYARLPTEFGEFGVIGYESLYDGRQHVALVLGDLANGSLPLVRVHSECLTGDAFSSLRCDCGFQLREAMRQIGKAGEGALVYVRGHEGRGIGLIPKLEAYSLQDSGKDTVEANEALGYPADCRDYGVSVQILRDLGVSRLRLLTNNPDKTEALMRLGLSVEQRIPLEIAPNRENRRYLETKASRLGHALGLAES